MKKDFNKTLHDFIPNYPSKGNNDSYIAKSGKKLENKTNLSMSNIIEILENIHDPEIPVNIYELGLIYDIQILENNNVQIKMSLTSPGCPVAGEMPQEVADKVGKLVMEKFEQLITGHAQHSRRKVSDDLITLIYHTL